MTFNRIRLGISCLALLILAACFSSMSSNAQSTTQGSIDGTVLDSSGAVVPGAPISIVRLATGFSVALDSDSSGYFKAPLLEPGTYTVSISAPNFAKYRADNVIVLVGQVTSIEPRLAVASSATEVVVTEQTPVMNLQSPDFSDTLNTTALQNIPINNRRWSALALTTPGVTVDASGYGLISVRGISTLLNNVEIDGADDNQAFFAEERGRTREAYSTAGSAVREFAVNTGVYSAEYGRAAGGVVTSVTKSGTNQLHGQAYFYDRESNWNAFNDYAFLTTFASGTTTKAHIKPEDLRKIYGFTVGGALIKDKLFWIYTYDQHTHVFPALGVPYTPAQFYTVPSTSLTGSEACNTTTGALTGTAAGGSNPLLRLVRSALWQFQRHRRQLCRRYSFDRSRPQLRARAGATLRIPGDQYSQARLAGKPQASRERALPPSALGLALRRADYEPRHVRRGFSGQRLRQARLRGGQAHQPHHQHHQQRSAVPIRPRT